MHGKGGGAQCMVCEAATPSSTPNWKFWMKPLLPMMLSYASCTYSMLVFIQWDKKFILHGESAELIISYLELLYSLIWYHAINILSLSVVMSWIAFVQLWLYYLKLYWSYQFHDSDMETYQSAFLWVSWDNSFDHWNIRNCKCMQAQNVIYHHAIITKIYSASSITIIIILVKT